MCAADSRLQALDSRQIAATAKRSHRRHQWYTIRNISGERTVPGMDTGRVDPRVGSARVEISEMHYFFSLSVDLSKFSYFIAHQHHKSL